MAISHHQEIVVQYLSADPRVFVSEEYLVGWGQQGKGEHIWVDVVAVDLSKQVAYLVEITSDPRSVQIIKKLNTLYSQNLPTIQAALLGGLGLPEGWVLRPWVFVRRDAVPNLLRKMSPDVVPRITYLETTAWEWEYGPVRREGKEPGKLYNDFDPRYQ